MQLLCSRPKLVLRLVYIKSMLIEKTIWLDSPFVSKQRQPNSHARADGAHFHISVNVSSHASGLWRIQSHQTSTMPPATACNKLTIQATTDNDTLSPPWSSHKPQHGPQPSMRDSSSCSMLLPALILTRSSVTSPSDLLISTAPILCPITSSFIVIRACLVGTSIPQSCFL